MFAIAALVVFIIAALIGFGVLGASISVIGLVALGLACLTVHFIRPWTPWRHAE